MVYSGNSILIFKDLYLFVIFLMFRRACDGNIAEGCHRYAASFIRDVQILSNSFIRDVQILSNYLIGDVHILSNSLNRNVQILSNSFIMGSNFIKFIH